MAIETNAARASSDTAPMSPPQLNSSSSSAAAAIAPRAATARRRGWLRRLMPRGDYLSSRSSRRWKLGGAFAGGGEGGGAASRLASSLSRSLRWKRLPAAFSLSLRSGASASAVVDAVAFRVMYVVEAVVLGLALSCFFLCCGCHL
uniref:Uncharacterized protein n=1 Tax=Leersia perrieri TaxID=77586 RepID=A0A0D9WJT2_9ORYZ